MTHTPIIYKALAAHREARKSSRPTHPHPHDTHDQDTRPVRFEFSERTGIWTVWRIDPDTGATICRLGTLDRIYHRQAWGEHYRLKLDKGIGVLAWREADAVIAKASQLDDDYHDDMMM